MNKSAEGRRVDPPNYESLERPGDFYFTEYDETKPGWKRIHILLPLKDTDHNLAVLPICPGDKTEPAWRWDGNLDKPTLTPSIDQKKFDGKDEKGDPIFTRIWHGHMVAGNLEAAADCP